jgi:hypothetical protein
MMRAGALWRDNVIPLGLGLVIGCAHWLDGGGQVAMLTGPVLCWALWQLGRRLEWMQAHDK